jgi:hypothetical protein
MAVAALSPATAGPIPAIAVATTGQQQAMIKAKGK